jgi:uncharacterized protein (UPF0218 family)
MSVIYVITPELRSRFKEPFGVLVKGSFDQTMAKISEIKAQNPPKIISVGDIVTKNLHTYGIPVDLAIFDNQCMRKKVEPITYVLKTIRVKNPQGTLTIEAIEAVREALKSNETIHISVQGEEDLLVLAAVLYAPKKSVVVYGQPYEGIVFVTVSPEKRAEVTKFLKAMEKCSKS